MRNKITMSDFIGLCDELADEFIEAAVKDCTNPETQQMLKDAVSNKASQVLGVNVNTLFIRPFYEKGLDFVLSNALDFVGLAIASPPGSVDAARDVLKETITEAHAKTDAKIDSLSEKLKQKLAAQTSATDTPSKD